MSRWTLMFLRRCPHSSFFLSLCLPFSSFAPCRRRSAGVSVRSDALCVQTRKRPHRWPTISGTAPTRRSAPAAAASPSEGRAARGSYFGIPHCFWFPTRERKVMMLRMPWWISLLCVCGLMHVGHQSSLDASNGNRDCFWYYFCIYKYIIPPLLICVFKTMFWWFIT